MKKRLLVMVAVAALCALAGASDPAASGSATLKFLVIKDANGKPVRNASVILHPVNKKGKQEKGGLQLKTNGEGEAMYAGVPFGKLRIQVIATGFQTFGNDYDINKDEMEISIRMKKPQD